MYRNPVVAMVTDWIQPSDPRWTEALGCVKHDLYHLPEYADLCSETDGGRAMAFLARSGSKYFLQPLLIRDLPEGNMAGECDAISPYGYSGAVYSTGDSRFISGAIAELVASARERDLLTILVRKHPLLPFDAEILARVGEVRTHGRTVFVDLGKGYAAVRSGMKSGTRNELARAVRDGLLVAEDVEWRSLEEFSVLYSETMKRAGADSTYFFDCEYFQGLRSSAATRIHLFCVRREDELVAAGIFSGVGDIVQYLFSGSTRTAPGATRLMLDHVFRWADSRGFRSVHLGGGVGAKEDSLFSFKAGFSAERALFQTWRVIVDAERYARLCPDADATGFFPAYRVGGD